MERTALHSVFH